jgi:hypothetical protein
MVRERALERRTRGTKQPEECHLEWCEQTSGCVRSQWFRRLPQPGMTHSGTTGICRASSVLCAVRTLNFAVSSTNLRVESAWPGSASATMIVGRRIPALDATRAEKGGPMCSHRGCLRLPTRNADAARLRSECVPELPEFELSRLTCLRIASGSAADTTASTPSGILFEIRCARVASNTQIPCLATFSDCATLQPSVSTKQSWSSTTTSTGLLTATATAWSVVKVSKTWYP